jgi:hypothetical protein
MEKDDADHDQSPYSSVMRPEVGSYTILAGSEVQGSVPLYLVYIVQAPQHACDCISCSKSGKNSQPKQTNYTHMSWRAKYNVKHQSSSSGHMKVLHENVVGITTCIANII